MTKLFDIVQRPRHTHEHNGHVLYTPSKKVTHFDKTLKNTVADMIATMHYEQGIGIAAPQVNIGQQIFIIEASLDASRYPHLKKYSHLKNVDQQIFINPKITKASHECIAYWHGCLSAKGLHRGLVKTYSSLSYSAQNLEGESISGDLDSLAAIIFQHEFRHLLGTLYIDHAKDLMEMQSLQDAIKAGVIDLYTEHPRSSIPHLLSDYKVGESIEEFAKRTLHLH